MEYKIHPTEQLLHQMTEFISYIDNLNYSVWQIVTSFLVPLLLLTATSLVISLITDSSRDAPGVRRHVEFD